MRAVTVAVPPEGATIELAVRKGSKGATVIVVVPEGIDVLPVSSPQRRKRPAIPASTPVEAEDQGSQYIAERLRKLKVRSEAAAINSIKAMFQFTTPMTESDAKSRLKAAAKDGDVLAPWADSLAGGDAEKGRGLFLNNAAVYCQRCHKLDGQGGEVGVREHHLAQPEGRSPVRVVRDVVVDPGVERVRPELEPLVVVEQADVEQRAPIGA